MTRLIDSIQKNMGYQPLYKIDPNTLDILRDEKSFGSRYIVQAALPSVVCGFYEWFHLAAENLEVLKSDQSDWLEIIFNKKKPELLGRIAAYADASVFLSQHESELIANETARLVKAQINEKSDYEYLNLYLLHERNEALFYLPAAIRMGTIMKNNTIDDRTHKMEGPISSLMHSIENHFE